MNIEIFHIPNRTDNDLTEVLSRGGMETDAAAVMNALAPAAVLGLTAPQLAAIADAFCSVGIGSAAASYSIAV